MRDERLRTWREWYRFARRRLEYAPAEAASYANLRAVEEQNRRDAPRRAGSPAP